MKWVTREKVKVDRVACPWLIKKFIYLGLKDDHEILRRESFMYDALYVYCQRRVSDTKIG